MAIIKPTPLQQRGADLLTRATNRTAELVLADGTVFDGQGIGQIGQATGEVVFNTAMTGYQEIMTDLSYAGQIMAFTFPHIGNVGTNAEDIEAPRSAMRGFVMRAGVTQPSNWRAARHLDDFAKSNNLVGITGVDTRRLTRLIRDSGFQNGVVAHDPAGQFDIDELIETARSWPGLEGMDLARDVTCLQTYDWNETRWRWPDGFGTQDQPFRHVVAVDFGAKHNILRCLADLGCKITVVPATATAEDILRHDPDGVFLSNGPGDPAATGEYAVPAIQDVLEIGKPVFGICLGHQMLALALGATTVKMNHGHHGANHPVKNLANDRVEITSMNHGFAVDSASLPDGVSETHASLFDGSNCGLKADGRPVFSVQYHPEASPGPQDSHYLFKQFVADIDAHKAS